MILACVVNLCCVFKLLEYPIVHFSVCPNLGTAFTYNERKNIWDTGAAHKPCKAWGYNDRSDLRCQIASLWCELLIRLAWALTFVTCTLEVIGLNLRQDTIWSGWILWFSSLSPDEYPEVCHNSFIPCSFQSPSRAHYTVQWDWVYSNVRRVVCLNYDAWMSEVIRNSCMKCHIRPNQLEPAEPNQDLHCQIVM